MPISRIEFEKVVVTEPIAVLIVSFLRNNKDKAYTINEIIDITGCQVGEYIVDDLLTVLNITQILDILIKNKKIRRRLVDHTLYYAIGD